MRKSDSPPVPARAERFRSFFGIPSNNHSSDTNRIEPGEFFAGENFHGVPLPSRISSKAFNLSAVYFVSV